MKRISLAYVAAFFSISACGGRLAEVSGAPAETENDVPSTERPPATEAIVPSPSVVEGAPVAVLATLGARGAALTLDEHDVYFATVENIPPSERSDPSDYAHLRVGRVSKAGGPVETLAIEKRSLVDKIFVTRRSVFVLSNRDLLRIVKANGTVTLLASNVKSVTSNEGEAFFLDSRDTIQRVGEGNPAPFATMDRSAPFDAYAVLSVSRSALTLVRTGAGEDGVWRASVTGWSLDDGSFRDGAVIPNRSGRPLARVTREGLMLVWSRAEVDVLDVDSLALAETTFLGAKGNVTPPTMDVGAFASSGGEVFFLAPVADDRRELMPYALLRAAAPGRPATRMAAYAGERLGPSLEADERHVYWIRRDDSSADLHGFIERRLR